jgi:chromosome segregation ATPase
MESVISLEQTSASLEEKREHLQERIFRLRTELKDLSVPAQVDGDKGAQTRISKIGAELSALDTETITIVHALDVIKGRLALARQNENIAHTQQQARDAYGHWKQLEAAGRRFDEHMKKAMEAYQEMEQHHRAFYLLGFKTPDRDKFRTMSERVLKGHLSALPLPIKNDMKLFVAPRERVTFSEIFDGYHDYLQGRQDGWNAQVEGQMSRILPPTESEAA